jgi:hypothetical protein
MATCGRISAMARAPRLIALGLIALGAVGMAVFAVFVLIDGRTGHTVAEVEQWSALRRGAELVVHSKWSLPLAGACGVAAAVGAGLAWFAWRGQRVALVIAAVLALCGIGAVWGARMVVGVMDGRGDPSRSPYVRAVTKLAIAGTGYFAVVALAAGIAYVNGRPRKPAPTESGTEPETEPAAEPPTG